MNQITLNYSYSTYDQITFNSKVNNCYSKDDPKTEQVFTFGYLDDTLLQCFRIIE